MNLIYETDRLILKVLRPEAAKKVLCFYLDNKELFEKYEASRPDNFYTVKYQKSVLLCEYNLTVQLSAVRFYVFLKDDPDRIIGTICFRDITRSIYDSCEVGYKFDERFWHHGYATEALIEGIDIMFGDLGLHRITACVMPGNTPVHPPARIPLFQVRGTAPAKRPDPGRMGRPLSLQSHSSIKRYQ